LLPLALLKETATQQHINSRRKFSSLNIGGYCLTKYDSIAAIMLLRNGLEKV